VKTVEEYRKQAEECRALARQMRSDASRAQLLEMAEIWDRLANERAAALAARPDGISSEPPKKVT
jgi:hypothetical protein